MKDEDIENFLYNEDRELFKNEYANLVKKTHYGYTNADWFRRNMFNATSRGSRQKYKNNKIIWQSKKSEISISHPLHQKHADVLSLLFSDNYGVSKPNKNGAFYIYTSLYHIAKKMGYKNPSSSATKVSIFIDHLRHTDFIIRDLDKNTTIKFTILGKSQYDKSIDLFVIHIDSESAKILTMSMGLKIEKKLNQKIIQISDRLSRVKALVRYLISNEPTKHGFTLVHIFEKFNIGQKGGLSTQKKEKSIFRKQLRENQGLLANFNIQYNEVDQKLYWSKHEKIIFEKAISPILIKSQIKTQIESSNRVNGRHLILKHILLNGTYFKIISIEKSKNDEIKIDIRLENMENKRVGFLRDTTIEKIELLLDA